MMVNTLNRDKEDEICDIIRTFCGGESPITFGDVHIDANG